MSFETARPHVSTAMTREARVQAEQNFVCAICLDVASDPVVKNRCQHVFCRRCVPTGEQDTACPVCTVPSDWADLSTVPALHRSYLKLPCKCPNAVFPGAAALGDGLCPLASPPLKKRRGVKFVDELDTRNSQCSWSGDLCDYLETHQHKCPHRQMLCSCGAVLRPAEREEHQRTCAQWRQACNICGIEFLFGGKKAHDRECAEDHAHRLQRLLARREQDNAALKATMEEGATKLQDALAGLHDLHKAIEALDPSHQVLEEVVFRCSATDIRSLRLGNRKHLRTSRMDGPTQHRWGISFRHDQPGRLGLTILFPSTGKWDVEVTVSYDNEHQHTWRTGFGNLNVDADGPTTLERADHLSGAVGWGLPCFGQCVIPPPTVEHAIVTLRVFASSRRLRIVDHATSPEKTS